MVDLWSNADGIEGLDAKNDMHDGLHFNASGNKKLFQKLQHVIRARYPALTPQDFNGDATMQMHFPYWGELASCPDSDGSSAKLAGWKWEDV